MQDISFIRRNIRNIQNVAMEKEGSGLRKDRENESVC